MLISCPKCQFSSEMDDQILPEWTKTLQCPKCGHSFPLEKGLAFEWHMDALADDFIFDAEEQPAASSYGAPKPIEAHGQALPPPLPTTKKIKTTPPTETNIPWETEEGWLFKRFVNTARMAGSKPSRFYSNLRPDGGYGLPITFVVALGYFAVSLFYEYNFDLWHIYGIFEKDLLGVSALFGGDIELNTIKIVLAVLPLVYPLFLLVHAGLVRALLPDSDGKRPSFQFTYRILCYGSAPYYNAFFPSIGVYLAFVWSSISIIIGLSQASRAGYARVVFAAVAPYFLYGAIVYLIVRNPL